MAEERQKKKKHKKDVNVIMALETEIQNAMRSCLSHFKQQSDSFILEGVRTLLQKDLVLKQFSLELHKTFIHNSLVKFLEEAGYDCDAPKKLEKVGEKVATTQETEESKDVEDICPAGDEKVENLQRGVKLATEGTEAKDYGVKVDQRKNLIKKAVTKRNITLAGVRRLLEEDLQLDKFALDPYRKFINQQVDEVLLESYKMEVGHRLDMAEGKIKELTTEVQRLLDRETALLLDLKRSQSSIQDLEAALESSEKSRKEMEAQCKKLKAKHKEICQLALEAVDEVEKSIKAQVGVLAPNLDLSEVGANRQVVDGKIVDVVTK